jgi:hypothetical protein
MPIPRLKKPETSNYKEIDYTELSNKLFIDIDKKIDKPPICIEIKDGSEYARFGTLGNFSVVGGKGKSRKTFFVSALVGSSLNGKIILNIKARFEGKKITYIDTEQSEYDLYWSAKRAVQLNNVDFHPENYDIFCLRPLSPQERVSFIENYLENNDNLGLVVIDGIRDLLVDINNPDQSTEIVTKIMQWTKTYNIHICLVLHQNPGSDKLRGHLGTEITNKAETYVSIEIPDTNKDISLVIPKAMRGTKHFKEFGFKINQDTILPELTTLEELPF